MICRKLMMVVVWGLMAGQAVAMKRPAGTEYNQGSQKKQNRGSISFGVISKTALAARRSERTHLKLCEKSKVTFEKRARQPLIWDTAFQGTPLHDSLQKEDIIDFWMCVQSGAKLDEKDKYDTPILHNVYFNNKDKDKRKWLDVLVDAGADVRATSKKNMTLLHKIASSEFSPPGDVEYLLKKGACVNAVNVDLWTPLHLASAGVTWHEDAAKRIKIFVDSETDLNKQNIEGDTPLHVGASNKNISLLLLCAGADVGIKNNNGQTPYDCSVNDGTPNEDLIDTCAANKVIKPHVLKKMGNPCFFLAGRSIGNKKRVGFRELTDAYVAANQAYDMDSSSSMEEDTESISSIEEDTD